MLVAGCGHDQRAGGGDGPVQPMPVDAQAPDGRPAPFGLDERPANPTCLAPARPADQAAIALTPGLGGQTFSLPVAVLQAPGDGARFFVVEKGGVVKVLASAGAAPTPFINITARVNSTPNEAGLLGMAFHPAFASNHQVFLSYTAPSMASPANLRSTVSRFISSDGGQTLDPGSEQILLTLEQPYTNHNGGNLAFGPDGFLYLGFGDGGSAGDPRQNGQNVNVLFGKILRIDVDHPAAPLPYGIPAGNPFARGGGRGEIFAWGLRNPWRWSFDRQTGGLWVGDVGQDVWEEIDQVQLGGNYGWNVREGRHCYPPGSQCQTAGLIDPVAEYQHGQGRLSVTGGYVYRGTAIPSLVGTYLYGDYGSGTIWGLLHDATSGAPAPQVLVESGLAISSFGEGADGELYVIDYGSAGSIKKIVPARPAAASTFPQTLSATGCTQPAAATIPATGLIPYDVNVPLWSDGAQKQRFFALPDGAKIHVGTDGDFDLPIGSVAVKTFLVAGQPVETRLLVRHQDGAWAGYSYEWNDAGTDAVLLPSSKTKPIGDRSWYFPARSECLLCHTAAAGRTLGLEIAQLNGDLTYPTGRLSNQLATLEHIGLFDAPLGHSPALLDRLPPASSAAPLDARARAYLHANCSICHRPQGTGQSNADLRYATPLAQVGVCNVAPQEGDLGVPGARLVVPGMPGQSIVSLRMHALDAKRMPPVASTLVDPDGTALVDSWIAALTGCP
jgi:uncharacterized repeat protein (TIGR03806 family)